MKAGTSPAGDRHEQKGKQLTGHTADIPRLESRLLNVVAAEEDADDADSQSHV